MAAAPSILMTPPPSSAPHNNADGTTQAVQSLQRSLTNPLYSDGRGTSVPIRIGNNRPYRELFLRPLQPR